MGLGWKILIIYLLLANIVAFALMAIDKRKAKKNKWRIKEKTLFLSAAVGGSIGAMYGMHMFRHKTQHKSFLFGMPAIFIGQVVLAVVIFCVLN
ncbi:MAG: DUF1294 domain-containing protein [Lachnospiraceae bacterium]|jgi:uncharacterized membrane protein YsdA (DUF1294 family)|nr:DUF1294 domain-containing protein [Bacteroidales bacterium]MBQ5560867.1 DUF1294 domain-containing protein [Lachnospiraceae bacterium]MCR4802684.1 DUF1294 domain-containing protein [Lachnospiraceae bacterium]